VAEARQDWGYVRCVRVRVRVRVRACGCVRAFACVCVRVYTPALCVGLER
jgi:hypothetical protein